MEVCLMIRKKELVLCLSIALILFVIANLGFARGIPDPSQGWDTDYHSDGAWNWVISANSTGHWRWITGQPSEYAYTEWMWEGQKGGGPGVWTEGLLMFWWKDDYGSHYIETDGNLEYTTGSGHSHLVNCTAKSGFGNWIGEHWITTVTSQITI